MLRLWRPVASGLSFQGKVNPQGLLGFIRNFQSPKHPTSLKARAVQSPISCIPKVYKLDYKGTTVLWEQTLSLPPGRSTQKS